VAGDSELRDSKVEAADLLLHLYQPVPKQPYPALTERRHGRDGGHTTTTERKEFIAVLHSGTVESFVEVAF